MLQNGGNFVSCILAPSLIKQTTYNGNTASRGFVFYSLPVPMNHTPTSTQTVGGGTLSSTYHTVERLAFYISLTNGNASAGNVDYFTEYFTREMIGDVAVSTEVKYNTFFAFNYISLLFN